MNAIPVPPYEAEYRVRYTSGKTEWLPCEVVGVDVPDAWGDGKFVIVTEDEDGNSYSGITDVIRRRKPSHQVF